MGILCFLFHTYGFGGIILRFYDCWERWVTSINDGIRGETVGSGSGMA